MDNAIFNNLVSLPFPEGFKQLSEEENKKFFTGDLLRLSFQDQERHILLSLSKSKDSFLNYLASIKSVAAGSLSCMANNLKDYQALEERFGMVLDKKAIIESFSYEANDLTVKQYGELTVLKIKNAFYVVYCLCRLEDKEKHQKIFEDFRNSLTYVNDNA